MIIELGKVTTETKNLANPPFNDNQIVPEGHFQ